jgi:hypothetical protein
MSPPSGPDVPPGQEPPPNPSGQAAVTGAVAVAALVFVVGGLAWAYHLLQEGGRKPACRPEQSPPVALAPTPDPEPDEQAPSHPPGPTLPPDPLVLAPEPRPGPLPLPLRVNQAIDRGLRHLRQDWCQPNEYQNYLGLLGLTLLECGVPRNDPAVRRMADLVRARHDLDRTYELSLAILFLDRLGDPLDDGLIRTFARRLVDGQNQSGSWWYTCFRRPAALPTRSVSPRRPPVRSHPPYDNSNTQFAVLGLWVAQRHGASGGTALRLAARHFRESQQDDGSWTYTGHSSGHKHSMTCAGLMSLALELGTSPGYVRSSSSRWTTVVSDSAITGGFRFLGKAFDTIADGGAVDAWGRLYFLWSLERVAAVYGLEKIGSREWYPWTAELLVRIQQDDGSWPHEGPGPVATCFALLILRRSNLTRDLLVTVPETTRPQQPAGVSSRPVVQDQPPRAGSPVTQVPGVIPVPTPGTGQQSPVQDQPGSAGSPVTQMPGVVQVPIPSPGKTEKKD